MIALQPKGRIGNVARNGPVETTIAQANALHVAHYFIKIARIVGVDIVFNLDGNRPRSHREMKANVQFVFQLMGILALSIAAR